MLNQFPAELLLASRGEPLPISLRHVFERGFRADLSTVRIHTGETAARVTASIGAAALAHGDDVFFAPGQYDPETSAGKWLLAHEIAHTLQQRGGMLPFDSAHIVIDPRLELQASLAASRLRDGHRFDIAPVPGCPPIMPAIPLAIWGLMAAAAAIGVWSSSREDDIKEDREAKDKHVYETGWGFIPFVGSVDQVMNGRSMAQRLVGTVFLVMDVSLAGGIVKGVALALRGAGRMAIAELAKGGGTATAREAYNTLIRNGAIFGTKQQVAKEILDLSRAGTIAVVGAEGAFNHSVTFLIKNGRIWKMHGGPAKFVFRTMPRKQAASITAEQAAKMTKKLNSVTLLRVDDSAAKQAIRWWSQEASARWWEYIWRAEGCAGTQAILLDKLGHAVAGSAGFRRYSPLLPIFMESARMAGPGLHRIINPGRMLSGSAQQLGAWLAIRDLPWAADWFISNELGERMQYEDSVQRQAEYQAMRGLQMERARDAALSTELWSDAPVAPLSGPLELQLPQDILEEALAHAASGNGGSAGKASPPPPLKNSPALPPLDAGEMRVYQALTTAPKRFDQLARQLGIPPRQITLALEGLVRKGLARWMQVNSDLFGYARAR